MSTFDVPGANPDNKDTLAPGCWAEHSDGRRLLVESVENGQVSYFIIKNSVAYRYAILEVDFKSLFTWSPPLDKDGDYEEEELVWIWHSKRPFPIAASN